MTLHPCTACGHITALRGRCASCRSAGDNARLAQRRYYWSPAWRRLRARQLRAWPTCQWLDCHARATQVDHIVPRTEGGADVLANLRSLCATHHSRVTRAAQLAKR